MFWACCVAFNIWLIFLGGAERLQHTWLGSFEFGQLSESVTLIKALAWVMLIVCGGLLVSEVLYAQ